MAEHQYQSLITWTGNDGTGTSDYKSYARSYDVEVAGKPKLTGSSDPAYHGDASRYNPEDLLLASLSSCHMLWYLHLCADAGICVTDYHDAARGHMVTGKDGSGEFIEVILNPVIKISSGDLEAATLLHDKAHSMCFIARSVNFPVRCNPEISMG